MNTFVKLIKSTLIIFHMGDDKSGAYAGFGVRFAALIIDLFIIFFILQSPIHRIMIRSSISLLQGSILEIGFLLLVFILYDIYLTYYFGSTIGKKLLGIMVVNKKKVKLSLIDSVARHFSKWISTLTLGIGYLMILWDDKKQALHDRISNTYVIDNPKRRIGNNLRNILVLIIVTFVIIYVYYLITLLAFGFKIALDSQQESLSKVNTLNSIFAKCNSTLPFYSDICYSIYANKVEFKRLDLAVKLDFCHNTCLAVVGTRKFSAYGRQATEEIVYQLAERGLTIISGLALGIDALAHLACLNANGKTVAILGSGADQPSVYPSSNRYLIDKIISSQGAVISEYPVGTAPTKYTFPMRNRIISGLAKGVLVIEAPESSGALITAKYALDQNRDVFAIPGSIYSHNSKGVNNLIKQGAKLITGADDILQEFNIQVILQETKNEPAISQEEEKIVFNLLSKEPLHIDKIKQLSKLNINVLLSTLTIMEIKSLIKDLGGKNYIRNF